MKKFIVSILLLSSLSTFGMEFRRRDAVPRSKKMDTQKINSPKPHSDRDSECCTHIIGFTVTCAISIIGSWALGPRPEA